VQLQLPRRLTHQKHSKIATETSFSTTLSNNLLQLFLPRFLWQNSNLCFKSMTMPFPQMYFTSRWIWTTSWDILSHKFSQF
jgi:hypothetical protein